MWFFSCPKICFKTLLMQTYRIKYDKIIITYQTWWHLVTLSSCQSKEEGLREKKKQFLMQVTKASRGKLQSNIISSEFPRILQWFPVIFSFSPWNDTSDQKWFWLMNVNTHFLYSEITIYEYTCYYINQICPKIKDYGRMIAKSLTLVTFQPKFISKSQIYIFL